MAKGAVTQSDDAAVFERALHLAADALDDEGVAYAVFGSIASAVYGRPAASGDVDLFVRRGDADRVLDALARAGFDVDRTDPSWIYKATKDGVLVDVIFQVKGGIYFDDEVASHAVSRPYGGRTIRMVSPEDAVVIEAASNEDQSPDHWSNALAIVAATPLDWEYLGQRARYSVRRILALLIYADSDDLSVPHSTVQGLFSKVYRE